MAKLLQQYLDGAIQALERFGIQVKQQESPLVGILASVSSLDEAKVLAVSKVLSYESAFNQIVRDNVAGMDVATRYDSIPVLFDSVVSDARMLIAELDDGKIDTKEKAQNLWMRLTRGTTHRRFEKIKGIHDKVSVATKDQLDRENAIKDAYIDFRFAYQNARTISLELMKTQEGRLKTAEQEAKAAADAVDAYMKGTVDQAELSKLQTVRDEKMIAAKNEDRNYQLFKDLTEGFSTGYNVGEVLVAKLMQTHEVKDQVYRRSSIFFATNEHIFTTLDAVFTSQLGLNEATQTLEAEKRVVNKGLEAVADLGKTLETAAIRAGYGSTTDPASVRKLVDSVVNYQIESRQLITQLREQSAKDAREVEVIVEDGKKRFADAAIKYIDTKTAPAQITAA